MIRQRLSIFDRAFRSIPHTVCYSVKANSTLAILRLLAKSGCGFDIVSLGELQRVLRADSAAAGSVVFSGVGKTAEEMRAALRAGIRMFNVESESELRTLAECARLTGKTAPVALRVNPDVPASTHPYISTGLQRHKFGIPLRQARDLYTWAANIKYLRVAGVTVHIGSQISDLDAFGLAMRRVADLVRSLRLAGHTIDCVDAGGGLSISYQGNESGDFAKVAAAYARALLPPLRRLKVHLLLEPGRCIVGPAGVLLTRVLYRKSNGARKFLIVDAAMNDLLRPALYGAHHEIIPVRCPAENDGSEITDVAGPVCETGDFLARGRKLPLTREGDLLAVLDAGAYAVTLASNYNTRPRPAEVLIDGRSVKLIRRRETIQDLCRSEI